MVICSCIYHDFNQGLWKKLELGQITRDHLLNTRFTTFFKEKSLEF